MAIATKAITLSEFLELPEETPELEYIDGRITQKVSPKSFHSAVQAEFVEQLNTYARPRKLARALPELRTTFAGQSRVPDVVVFHWERIPREDDGRLAQDVIVPPDITIEILSPGQSMSVLVRRCLWYVRNGVQLALAVDPDDETVLACHSDGRIEAWHGEDRIDLGELLPGFELTAQDLFACLS